MLALHVKESCFDHVVSYIFGLPFLWTWGAKPSTNTQEILSEMSKTLSEGCVCVCVCGFPSEAGRYVMAALV